MSNFESVRVTGPARELKPKRVGASFLLPITGSVTTEWQEAFNNYPWTFNALKERRPRVHAVDGEYGVGLALSVFEAPATPWPMLHDAIKTAIDEINETFGAVADAAAATALAEQTATTAKLAAAQAVIDADWSTRQAT